MTTNTADTAAESGEAAASAEGSAGGPVRGADGRLRCPWAATAEDYAAYHDTEWGRRVRGDDALFERLCLEAFQSGLSWLTILRKREAFRAAFAGFEIGAVAAFTAADEERLLADAGIVRNRAKISATLANAQTLASWEPGELDALIWSFAPEPASSAPRTLGEVPASTPESKALARELKRRGLRFVGPTTAYATMQAAGLVDDHLAECWVRTEGAHARG